MENRIIQQKKVRDLDEKKEMPTVYTIGHSNLHDYQFFELLHQYEITVVADVRSSPNSQYVPQFNRGVLEFAMLNAGFDYQFFGDTLGGRPDDRRCYFAQEIPEGKADYLHLVDYEKVMTMSFFLEGIEKLKAIAETDSLVVMCSEGDPSECHRHHMIAKFLLREGYSVKHILKDSTLVSAVQLPSLPKNDNSTQLDLFG